jgi:hypothetical protein
MAKRRTYEDKLLEQLNGLPGNKWFLIKGRDDFEKITVAVKGFISVGEQFEFSSCYTKIKRLSDERMPELYHKMKVLPPGVTIETISPGYLEWIEHKGKQIQVEHEKTSYRIFNNGRLIAIEFVK